MNLESVCNTCSMYELCDVISTETRIRKKLIDHIFGMGSDCKCIIYNTTFSKTNRVYKQLLELGFVEVFSYIGNTPIKKNSHLNKTVTTLMLDVSQLK